MRSGLKDNMIEYFMFDDEVIFGTVSHGGCRSLEKKYSSTMRQRAEEEGLYILGLGVNDGCGYDPTVEVEYNNRREYIYVVGKLINGKMYEILTGKEIKYVDDVSVIRFNAPITYERYSDNVWGNLPIINHEEYKPGYYFSDLCYVNCNKLDKSDIDEYLDYFYNNISLFTNNYYKKLNDMQKDIKIEYNRINNAYNYLVDNKKEQVDNGYKKILVHKNEKK